MSPALLSLLIGLSAHAEDDTSAPEAEPEATEEEAEEEAAASAAVRVYDLTAPAGSEGLGSALDDIGTTAAEEAASGEGALEALLREEGVRLPSALRAERPQLRGRLWLRPQLGVGGVQAADGSGQSALLLGGAAGHLWWGLTERPTVLGGETRFEALFPVGGAVQGGTMTLSSVVGPWVGPVGLQVGPVARLERATWETAAVTLPGALLVGGRATLSADLGGRVQLYGGYEHTRVTGAARSWAAEPAWLGGAAVRLGWLQIHGQGTLRTVGDDQVWGAGLGLRLLPQLDSLE